MVSSARRERINTAGFLSSGCRASNKPNSPDGRFPLPQCREKGPLICLQWYMRNVQSTGQGNQQVSLPHIDKRIRICDGPPNSDLHCFWRIQKTRCCQSPALIATKATNHALTKKSESLASALQHAIVDPMAVQHAFEFLKEDDVPSHAVTAVFGGDTTLRLWSLQRIVGDADATEFDGDSAIWSDMRDDLSTASLFDMGEKRAIIIRNADRFVSSHRSELEDYINKPSTASRLVLDLGSLASNTRIYKSLNKDHLLVACGSGSDKKMGVTAATRRKFLTSYVADRHQTKLSTAAADALVEMLGEDIGYLDTEIAKLALYCDEGQGIEEDLVRDIVAGWQGKTVWQITDAIAAGDSAEALKQLDKLMSGGQRPIALLPQIAWSLRRLGMATAVVKHHENTGRTWNLNDALSAAGMRRPDEIQRGTKQLKGLGRERASQLLPWLLDSDLRLKGTHSTEGRDRFLLEQLVLKLARDS